MLITPIIGFRNEKNKGFAAQNLEEKSTQELDTNTMYLVFLTNSRSYFKKMKMLTLFGKSVVYWLISRGLDYNISGPLKLASKQQTFQILSTSSDIFDSNRS